jgi:two-component sensor histidine kinase
MAYAPAALAGGLAGGWVGGGLVLLVAAADLIGGGLPAPAGTNTVILSSVLLLLAAAGAILGGYVRRHGARAAALEAELALGETRQADAVQRAEALQRELSHRVKNNFQLVGSLLRLQARKADNDVASHILNTTILRIQSMSALQESLYRNRDIGRVDIGHYLREVCTRLAEAQIDGRDIQLTVEADTAELPGEYALPLGLAVSELVSNSLRHAFTGGRSGHVRVTLRVEGSDFVLAVENDGAPLADIETVQSRGFGLLLVSSCAQQLEGELAISGQPPRFEIRFPATLAA